MSFETPGRLEDNIDVQIDNFNGQPSEQLPRYTSRKLLYQIYSFLLCAFSTAIVVQSISFVPIAKPHVSRSPFIAVGCVMFAVGALKLSKKEIPGAGLAGVLIGSVMGL